MEAEPKITSVEKTQKTKDPRKVEAGKKLAAISKAAKERKAIERERAVKVDGETFELTNVLAYSVAVAVVLGGLLYTRYGKTKTEYEPESEPEPEKEKRPKVSLDSLD